MGERGSADYRRRTICFICGLPEREHAELMAGCRERDALSEGERNVWLWGWVEAHGGPCARAHDHSGYGAPSMGPD